MNKLYITIIIILLILLGISNIFKRDIKINIDDTLKDNEISKVSINKNKNIYTLQQRDKDNVIAESIFIPEESKVKIITDKNNNTEIKYSTIGFTLKPNLTISYMSQLSLGLGIRWLYWNEFGIVSHLNYLIRDNKVSFSTGIDYRLYRLNLKNIAIGIGYDTNEIIKWQINIYFS